MITAFLEHYMILIDELFPLALFVYPFEWTPWRYTVIGAWVICFTSSGTMFHLGDPKAFFIGFLAFLLAFFVYGEFAPDAAQRRGR
ncbi:MAG: hypothetical protein VW405_06960 [Rhodospirillaceae bacterium]